MWFELDDIFAEIQYWYFR